MPADSAPGAGGPDQAADEGGGELKGGGVGLHYEGAGQPLHGL